jgi:capsular polysaccharide biosynthesis protein
VKFSELSYYARLIPWLGSRFSLSRVHNFFIGGLWRLLRLFSKLGVGNIGTLTVLLVERSPRRFHDQPVFFEAEEAIRADNAGAGDPRKGDIYPELSFRKFQNALVTSNRRITAVIQGGKFYVPYAADSGPWKIRPGNPNIAGLLRQEDSRLLVNLGNPRKRIQRGVMVGTLSPHNWFHWTIDTLPSVYLSQFLPAEYDDFPLLLPAKALSRPHWLEPLELVLGQRSFLPLSDQEYSRVSDLVWVDSPTSPGPLPLNPTSLSNYRVHGSALRSYRNQVLRNLGLEENESKVFRKIFLARRQDGHRPYNQAELLELAAAYGFEPVMLDEMSFRESVKICAEARFIIGPHGAGWANSLYASSHSKGLLWTWPAGRKDNWFANVAASSGMSLKVVFTGHENSNPYHLEPETLRAELEKL